MILEEHPRGGGNKHALEEGEKNGFKMEDNAITIWKFVVRYM